MKKAYIVLLLIILSCAFYYIFSQSNRFDYEKIISLSSLKDKKFNVKPVEIISNKGLSAWLVQDKQNPIIALDFMFKKSGLAYDKNTKQGTAYLLSTLLDEGAGKYSSKQFQELEANNGISIGFNAGKTTFNGSLLTTSDKKDLSIELLKTALNAPRFTGDAISRMKAQLIAGIKRSEQSPFYDASNAIMKSLFAAHPYARKSPADIEMLSNIERPDLFSYMEQHFTKDNLIISIAGDISEDDAAKMIDEIFGKLPNKSEIGALSRPLLPPQEQPLLLNKQVTQAAMIFGGNGIERNSPDFYPAYIATQIFGGNDVEARLNKKIRVDEGIAYSVSADLDQIERTPLIMGSLGTNNNTYHKALKMVQDEINNIHNNGITKEEFDRTKKQLINSFLLRFNSTAGMASMLSAMQYQNLGIDFLSTRNAQIEAVTYEQANDIAKKLFTPDNFTFIAVGDINKINNL